MNNAKPSTLPSTLVAHAVALADAHSQGCEKRCRRWRRRAATRRLVVMALLAVAILFVVGSVNSALANQTYALGELPTDEAVVSAHAILMNP